MMWKLKLLLPSLKEHWLKLNNNGSYLSMKTRYNWTQAQAQGWSIFLLLFYQNDTYLSSQTYINLEEATVFKHAWNNKPYRFKYMFKDCKPMTKCYAGIIVLVFLPVSFSKPDLKHRLVQEKEKNVIIA